MMTRPASRIEIKIVMLVAGALVIQDVALLVSVTTGIPPQQIQIILGAVLCLSIIVAAVWGNAVERAIWRLTQACYVARKGDTEVMTELVRTDELRSLNDEINELVVLLRDVRKTRAELDASEDLTSSVSLSAPDVTRATQEIIISLKELSEGASAERSITSELAEHVIRARRLIEEVLPIREESGGDAVQIASRLESLRGIATEIDTLADMAIDEVARDKIDEAALARIMNGLRDASRTMVEVASQAAEPLRRRAADVEAATEALTALRDAVAKEADSSRVAELMGRSAGAGLSAAMRLASVVKRLGLAVEAYTERRRHTARR